jgi:hypothetical protein
MQSSARAGLGDIYGCMTNGVTAPILPWKKTYPGINVVTKSR